jgi:hypothetical protein
MKEVKHLSAITFLAIGSLLIIIMVGRADATPYSFSVDRFHIAGNLPVDAVDEFDDGVLDPWNIQEGTAVESGEMVTFSNPGGVEDFIQDNLHITLERSSVEVSTATGTFGVADGEGNFIVESRWLPVLPDLNLGYGMTFHYPPSGFDQVRIGIDNLDALALSLGGAPVGTEAGSYISFSQISPEPGTGIHNFTIESKVVPIAAADITGDIVFQLLFDDVANSFSAAYSLDGGSTFNQPFSPFSLPLLTGPIEGSFVELEASSLTVQLIEPYAVGIDIKPGSFPNAININGKGVIPVAVLGSADFDVRDIKIGTLSFAGLVMRVKGNNQPQCSFEDVSGDFSGGPEGAPDGYEDLVCHFVNDPEKWNPEDGEAILTGELLDGTLFGGIDSIKVIE